MSMRNSLVATYVDHLAAIGALKQLRREGFDMSHISLIAPRERMPDLADVKVDSGPESLAAPRYACIPPDMAADYRAELEAGRLVLVAYGSEVEIDRVKAVVDTAHPESWSGDTGCAIYYGCDD